MPPSRSVVAAAALLLALSVPGGESKSPTKDLAPVTGWNTWCTQNECGKDWCTAAEVLSVGRAMRDAGMLEAGYEWLNLDDCWGARNPETTHIEGDPERFPQGMASFVEDVHALGFKLGVYTDMGPNACTAPFAGSWPYYKQDAEDFAAWGVDYVKFDYCSPPEGFEPSALTANMSAALEASGRDIFFNFHCNWLTFEDARCAAWGNSFRVAPDHVDKWYSTLKTSAVLADRKPWWGPSNGGESDDEGSGFPLGYPDPDFAFTGGEGCGDHSAPGERCPGQTDDEYVTEWSLNAIASGQLLFASDPRNMTALQRDVFLNEEVLAVFRDVSGLKDVAVVSNYSLSPTNPSVCGVEMTEQLSGTACVAGESFGCVAKEEEEGEGDYEIWTSGGCRGLFTCYGTPNVNCESSSGDYPSHENATCSCKPPAPQVWVRPLSSSGGEGEGGGAVVAALLFNAADEAMDVELDFEDVDKVSGGGGGGGGSSWTSGSSSWTSGSTALVRDLWLHEDLGTFTGSFVAKAVPPHASVFVRVEAAVAEAEAAQ
jgi:alpha-galactosidase